MAQKGKTAESQIVLLPETNQSSSDRLQQSTWRAVLAGLLVVSYGLTYLKLVPLTGGLDWRLITSLLLAVLLCFGCSLIPRAEAVSSWIPLIMAVAVGLPGIPQLRRGFLGFLNYLIGWWNLKYQDGRVMFQLKDLSRQDLLYFGIILGLLILSAVCHVLRRRRIRMMELLVLGILIPGVILNRFSAAGFACALSAGAGIWMYRLHDQANGRRAGWMAGLSVLLLAGACLFPNRELPEVGRFRQGAVDQLQLLRYGEDSLPQGDLRRSANMHEGDQERLRVRTKQGKDLYLRGFVGADYSNGRWSALSRAVYGGDNSGMLKWLKNQNFVPAEQYAGYEKLGVSQNQSNQLRVENLGASRKYLYLPYSVSEVKSGKYTLNQDSGFHSGGVLGCNVYAAEEVSGTLPAELLHQEEWLTKPETSGQEHYIESESIYRNFVYKNYGAVDERLAPLIRENILEGSILPEGIYTAAAEIRKGLESRMAYEERPTLTSAEASAAEDPLYEFLSGRRSGNDAMYASAAVQAFRLCQIPARYAEGYLLKSQDAQKAAGASVTLTSKDAHAWCEVYMDGMGWVPVDTTPGYYYDTYALIQLLEYPQGVMQTSAEQNSDEEADQILQEDETRASGDGGEELQSQVLAVLMGIWTVLVAAAAVILLLAEVIRAAMELHYRRRLRTADTDGRIRLQCDTILAMLSALGIDAHPGWKNSETEQALRQKLPAFEEGEYLRVCQVMERFLYGKQELETYEERVLTGFAGHLRQRFDQLPKLEYLRVRWFRPVAAVKNIMKNRKEGDIHHAGI